MKTVSLQVADELFDAFQQAAVQSGRPVEAVACEWLAKHARGSGGKPASPEAEAARSRFRERFGSARSGNPRSADNAQIDLDLDREYGSIHREDG